MQKLKIEKSGPVNGGDIVADVKSLKDHDLLSIVYHVKIKWWAPFKDRRGMERLKFPKKFFTSGELYKLSRKKAGVSLHGLKFTAKKLAAGRYQVSGRKKGVKLEVYFDPKLQRPGFSVVVLSGKVGPISLHLKARS